MPNELIQAPDSNDTYEIVKLGYIDAYDAVLNDDYAFVIYKETDRGSGQWRVRIRARHLTGVVFEPEAMRQQSRAAGAQGKAFFTWGSGIDPSPGDGPQPPVPRPRGRWQACQDRDRRAVPQGRRHGGCADLARLRLARLMGGCRPPLPERLHARDLRVGNVPRHSPVGAGAHRRPDGPARGAGHASRRARADPGGGDVGL